MTEPLPSGRRPFLPAALRYDGATRDFALDDNGSHRGVHPVDQQVALSFSMSKGDCPRCPEIGHTLREIKHLTAPDVPEQVRTRVLDAFPFSRLIEEKKIKVHSIQHAVRSEGSGLIVAIDYTNTVTGERFSKSEWYT